MKLEEEKYSKYALCREMMEAATFVKNFNQEVSQEFIQSVKNNHKIFITGEGSSRIFPAKHFIYQLLSFGINLETITEGALQALEHNLDDFTVFGVQKHKKRGFTGKIAFNWNSFSLVFLFRFDFHVVQANLERGKNLAGAPPAYLSKSGDRRIFTLARQSALHRRCGNFDNFVAFFNVRKKQFQISRRGGGDDRNSYTFGNLDNN